jgi:hypothetical protein
VKCSGAIDLDPTVDRGGENGSHRRLGFRRARGQGWTPATFPRVSGQRRGYDGLQRSVGNSGAWSSSRFASSRGGERWPEVRWAEMDFGR